MSRIREYGTTTLRTRRMVQSRWAGAGELQIPWRTTQSIQTRSYARTHSSLTADPSTHYQHSQTAKSRTILFRIRSYFSEVFITMRKARTSTHTTMLCQVSKTQALLFNLHGWFSTHGHRRWSHVALSPRTALLWAEQCEQHHN